MFVVSNHTATILLYFLLLFPRGFLVFNLEAWLREIVLDKNYTSSLVDNPDIIELTENVCFCFLPSMFRLQCPVSVW